MQPVLDSARLALSEVIEKALQYARQIGSRLNATEL